MSDALFVQSLGVFATFTAAVVALVIALYGEQWRAKLHPPKLKLALDVPEGKRLTIDSIPCLWFCVRVTNENRTRNANDVRLVLLSVTVVNDTPMFQDWQWTGEVPMQRSHPEIYTAPAVVGPAALFDLFAVYRDHRVLLVPALLPNDLQTKWATPTHLMLTLQARSNEADSEIRTVRIRWNGGWDDHTGVAKDLMVEETSAAP